MTGAASKGHLIEKVNIVRTVQFLQGGKVNRVVSTDKTACYKHAWHIRYWKVRGNETKK